VLGTKTNQKQSKEERKELRTNYKERKLNKQINEDGWKEVWIGAEKRGENDEERKNEGRMK
jgi:hypothetical protein